MKKTVIALCAAAMALAAVSCGSSPKKPSVNMSLDTLDDYFDVVSYTIETNLKEKGPEYLDQVTGSFTLTVKRNKEEMKLKPSHLKYATLRGRTPHHQVIYADCEGTARKMMKMEPGTTETFIIRFESEDPCYSDDTPEEKAAKRKEVCDALNDASNLSSLEMEIYMKEDFEDTLNSLKDLLDDDDDD